MLIGEESLRGLCESSLTYRREVEREEEQKKRKNI